MTDDELYNEIKAIFEQYDIISIDLIYQKIAEVKEKYLNEKKENKNGNR